jgi:hypothetical protein
MDSHSILNVEYYYSRHPKAKGGDEVADLFRWCGDVLCENQCYSDPPEVDPETGEEGGACYGNGTCNEGLICEDGVWRYIENCGEIGLTCDREQGKCV